MNRPELLEQPPQSSTIVVFGGRAAWQIPSDEVQYVGEDAEVAAARAGWRRVCGIWTPPKAS